MDDLEQLNLDKIPNTDHEIYPLLKQRWSPRAFSDDEVEEKELQRLFEAVRWSASSYNIQPWRFIYAHKDSEGYDKIKSCLTDFNKSWVVNAPVLMLTFYKTDNDKGDDNRVAMHDLGLAMGSMTIQAQYMNIALHMMAGIEIDKIKETFDIPEGFEPATGVAIGYYGGDLDQLNDELKEREKKERQRMPQEEFAFKNSWNS
ncbi:nitroreductase family protein [Robertkochia aurantiaca]|uniref:nitroreductase family protein n=1 Tax=Robertkochia aurantiaca TaxID=2873700 RepID=UPI001CCF1ED9|nr:nitroreductase family protein [Robertkochia sp. 3YJGBD-33]